MLSSFQFSEITGLDKNSLNTLPGLEADLYRLYVYKFRLQKFFDLFARHMMFDLNDADEVYQKGIGPLHFANLSPPHNFSDIFP